VKNGGKLEVLGGLSQTSGSKDIPMFVLDGNAQLSLIFSEVNHSQDPYAIFVRETRNGRTETWGDPNKSFRGWRPIFFEAR
ncbi:MAG: hypothetical protein HC888_03685, partial [Candidatus Competibacteraceae bacterium]|nr:hypothetical protein [Candidatus Competibacteraceae bacterium]